MRIPCLDSSHIYEGWQFWGHIYLYHDGVLKDFLQKHFIFPNSVEKVVVGTAHIKCMRLCVEWQKMHRLYIANVFRMGGKLEGFLAMAFPREVEPIILLKKPEFLRALLYRYFRLFLWRESLCTTHHIISYCGEFFSSGIVPFLLVVNDILWTCTYCANIHEVQN